MTGFVESLFKWTQTFNLPSRQLESLNDLLDGTATAQILNIIAPEYFTKEWLSKLKNHVSPDNWRLRVSNLRKILDQVLEYYENVLLISAELSQPDVHLIGRDGDTAHLARLLQLVLVIAVNCEQKQLYIENITCLELHVQQNLMEAIQQLMMASESSRRHSVDSAIGQNGQSTDCLSIDQQNAREQLLRTMENLRIANEKKEQALKQNYELSRRLLSEQNEKIQLQQDYDQLSDQLKQLLKEQQQQQIKGGNSDNNKDALEMDVSRQKLLSKIENLERELVLSEQQREECLIKLELIERELMQLRLSNEQLQRQVKQTQELQDELDIHKHSADKVVKYEQTLETYRRRLEELADLRREWKTLEEKNLRLVATNLELEEELRKSNMLRQQVADYRSKMHEMQQELLERSHRCDRLEFELDKQKERLQLATHEKQLLEREQIELRGQVKQMQGRSRQGGGESAADELDSIINSRSKRLDAGCCLELEIAGESSELREKLLRLEHENKLLKMRLEQTNQEAVLLLRNSYRDAQQRVGELETDNRKLNKRIIELESRCNEQDLVDPKTTNDSQQQQQLEERLRLKSVSAQMLNNRVHELEQRLAKLQGELNRKDDDFNEMECRYQKYLHKAKQAVHLLELVSTSNGNGQQQHQQSHQHQYQHQQQFIHRSSSSSSQPIASNGPISAPVRSRQTALSQSDALACGSVDALRAALAEKDQKISQLVVEMERARHLSEMESRLITVAVHNIAFNLQRKAATQRIMSSKATSCNNSGQNNNHSISNSNGTAAATTVDAASSSDSSESGADGGVVNGSCSLLGKQRQAIVRRNHNKANN